jgi:hypothetical protein
MARTSKKTLKQQKEIEDLGYRFFLANNKKKKAEQECKKLREFLLTLVEEVGDPVTDKTLAYQCTEHSISVQRQLSGGGKTLDETAAGQLIEDKYPKLKRKVFSAFDADVFAQLALDGEISRTDYRKVMEEVKPTRKLVVTEVTHDKDS